MTNNQLDLVKSGESIAKQIKISSEKYNKEFLATLRNNTNKITIKEMYDIFFDLKSRVESLKKSKSLAESELKKDKVISFENQIKLYYSIMLEIKNKIEKYKAKIEEKKQEKTNPVMEKKQEELKQVVNGIKEKIITVFNDNGEIIGFRKNGEMTAVFNTQKQSTQINTIKKVNLAQENIKKQEKINSNTKKIRSLVSTQVNHNPDYSNEEILKVLTKDINSMTIEEMTIVILELKSTIEQLQFEKNHAELSLMNDKVSSFEKQIESYQLIISFIEKIIKTNKNHQKIIKSQQKQTKILENIKEQTKIESNKKQLKETKSKNFIARIFGFFRKNK